MFVSTKEGVLNESSGRFPAVFVSIKYRCFRHEVRTSPAVLVTEKLGAFTETSGQFSRRVCGNKKDYLKVFFVPKLNRSMSTALSQ